VTKTHSLLAKFYICNQIPEKSAQTNSESGSETDEIEEESGNEKCGLSTTMLEEGGPRTVSFYEF
jgi:hypothetical protein